MCCRRFSTSPPTIAAAGDVHAGDGNRGDPIWPDAMHDDREGQRATADTAITAQMFPRPIGLVIGLELTGNPFVMYPSYRDVADLPLAERLPRCANPKCGNAFWPTSRRRTDTR
jgi:hypothetical protein